MTEQTRSPEITPEHIRRLVDAFYGDIQRDPELGPIFDRVVGQSPGGWPPHLDKMVAFWSAVLLGIPGYVGNPKIAHYEVEEIRPEHFARWLQMFNAQVYTIFDDDPAEQIMFRAQQMGRHLSHVVASRGTLYGT